VIEYTNVHDDDLETKHDFIRIGKQRALSREVTCNFRLYLKIERTSVKARVITTEYRACVHFIHKQHLFCNALVLEIYHTVYLK